MRRTIYGTGITLLWCLFIYFTGGNQIVLVLTFFEGLSFSLLWDIGAISNYEAGYNDALSELNEGEKK